MSRSVPGNKYAVTHGLSYTPEYRAWVNMNTRCNNPNQGEWHRYGGRGISVCERWSKFENFMADMGPRPSDLHSLEREDGNGNYEPGNCRWANKKEQARNIQTNHIVEIDGRAMTLAEAAENSGIAYNTVLYRIKRGWSVTRALTEAVHARR